MPRRSKARVRRRGALGPLVVDANILFSALIRNGSTRHLLYFGQLDLHTPEVIWNELSRNRAALVAKSGATDAAFELLVEGLHRRIGDIQLPVLRQYEEEAVQRLGPEGLKDWPYLAACLAIHGTLWTHDKRLKRDSKVPSITTMELLDAMEG